jgi:hypothetical protein
LQSRLQSARHVAAVAELASLDGIRQFHTFRSVVRWRVAFTAATFVAAVPTRLNMHNFAVGFPFTWRTHQEIIASGEQPHSFSLWLLPLDIALVLVVFVLLRIAVSRLIHGRGADERVTNHAA